MKYQNLLPIMLLIALVWPPNVWARLTPEQKKLRRDAHSTKKLKELRKSLKELGKTEEYISKQMEDLSKPIYRGRKVEFDLRYNFSTRVAPSKIKFVTVIPGTIPDRQQVLEIKYSTEPLRVFSRNGNDYAEFVFVKPRNNFKLKINVKAELFKYDLYTAQKRYEKIAAPEDPNIGNFLRHQEFIEKDDPQIQQLAKSIKARTETALVRKLYQYVINNMKYVNNPETDLGAARAVEKKRGDCMEYSDLFVALCRAKGIPARVIKGYVTERAASPKHAWAEVYLQKLGWVPFDPTFGDVRRKSARKRKFQKLTPIYIYLNCLREDKMTLEYSSVLGPVTGEIKVEDSIRFRKLTKPSRRAR